MSKHEGGILDGVIERCRSLQPLRVAVVAPHSAVALEGALQAAAARLIEPIFIGATARIESLAREQGLSLSNWEVMAAECDAEAAAISVALCRSGRAQALMKGSLHTDVLMRAVLREKEGLRTARRVSHVFVLDAPAYPRPLLITDAAINIYPTLEEKVDIVQNAIDLAHALGIDVPNVAILSALETVNPKVIATVEAAALCKMADRGQIVGAAVDGPLAFDTAVSARAAEIKQLRSVVAGRADILVVPDMESGNMLAKQLEYLGNASLAGVVVGAQVPIILTSRADAPKARLASAAVAVLAASRHKTLD